MRILIVVPIIHSEQDMGSLLAQTKQAYIARYGEAQWATHLQSIEQVWIGIAQMITALELPYLNVRIYQDGLPVCGKEVEIVSEVASQGSQNYQLVQKLVAQGAQLMGTDDPTLLLQEYRLHVGTVDDAVAHAAQSKIILAARDHFIANRINTTLQVSEVGLLFLGMAHTVESLLDTDILVRYLLPSLRQKQEEINATKL
ncbi:MAG: hypothetical protein WAO71_03400 [Gallionella sp.]